MPSRTPKHDRYEQLEAQGQGALFAAPRLGTMAVGAPTHEVEGGVYRDPSAPLVPPIEAPIISPEASDVITRLQAEVKALNALATENKSSGNVQHKTNQANAINAGIEYEPAGGLEALGRSASRSSRAIDGLRLASKGFFAQSIGIETYTKYEYKTGPNGEIQKGENDKPVVIGADIAAKDPDLQGRLDIRYERFRLQYAGTSRRHHLVARRNELNREIASLESPQPSSENA